MQQGQGGDGASAGKPDAAPRVLLLTTGGTIAGWAESAADQQHYQAGVLSGDALLRALAHRPEGVTVQVDEWARINSKDADARFWYQLYQRVQTHLADAGVAGIVITHGTDTLEESAFFLSELLPAPLPKPVVLVAAMRPASHPQADGPQNLAYALQLASPSKSQPQWSRCGVLVTCGGRVYGAADVQKWHGSSVQPFISRAALRESLSPVGQNEASPSFFQPYPHFEVKNLPEQLYKLEQESTTPRVEILSSHAGNTGGVVDALLAQQAGQGSSALYGLVVAGTGCGTIHQDLQAALLRAQARGVQVVRASQCLGDVIAPPEDGFICWPQLSPRQARVRLMLQGLLG